MLPKLIRIVFFVAIFSSLSFLSYSFAQVLSESERAALQAELAALQAEADKLQKDLDSTKWVKEKVWKVNSR
jgi:hypothetical protein